MHEYSPSQRTFAQEALRSNFRPDGRTPTQKRTVDLRSNILDNLAGSSFVSMDLGKTEIYAGVKLRIAEGQQGTVNGPSVLLELSCMRRLTPQLSDILAYLQVLLQEHFINRERGLMQLAIPNAKRHYIQLHIQAFLLSEPHAGLIEPLFLSVKQALLSTALPQLECFLNEVTDEQTVEIGNQSGKLQVGAVEAMMLVGCLQGKYLLELTPLEYEAVDAVYLVVVGGGKVVSVQSLKGAVSAEQVHKICRFALNYK